MLGYRRFLGCGLGFGLGLKRCVAEKVCFWSSFSWCGMVDPSLGRWAMVWQDGGSSSPSLRLVQVLGWTWVIVSYGVGYRRIWLWYGMVSQCLRNR